MDKQEIRKKIRETARSTSNEQHQIWSEALCQTLDTQKELAQAKTIAAYWHLADEPDITPLIEQWWKEGKTVLLPEVIDETNMRWHTFQGKERMTADMLDIQTSIGEVFTQYETIDCVIVPGRAFDKENHRLGRGRGYYDRFLALTPALRIGVAFPYQRVEMVPTDIHDLPMHKVIFADENEN